MLSFSREKIAPILKQIGANDPDLKSVNLCHKRITNKQVLQIADALEGREIRLLFEYCELDCVRRIFYGAIDEMNGHVHVRAFGEDGKGPVYGDGVDVDILASAGGREVGERSVGSVGSRGRLLQNQT